MELEERGWPGFRAAVAVKRCTAFEPATAIDCRRRCLDRAFRTPWTPALPLGGGR